MGRPWKVAEGRGMPWKADGMANERLWKVVEGRWKVVEGRWKAGGGIRGI